MNLVRTLVLLGVMISGFMFFVSLATLYAQTKIEEGTACSCTPPVPILIPTFSSLGILVGLMTYYLISPLMKKTCMQSLELILDMLEPEEALVIKALLINGGEVSQARLSRELGKVRAFRTIERLKRRGIIDKESYGKTNKIKFSKKFQKLTKLTLEERLFRQTFQIERAVLCSDD